LLIVLTVGVIGVGCQGLDIPLTRTLSGVERAIDGALAVIATDKFVYIHLHKSAGSFVSTFLLNFMHGAVRIGYHLPVSMRPTSISSLPVLGTVRNPWEVYVSYYFFQQELLHDARRRLERMSSQEVDDLVAAGNDPLNGVDVLFQYVSDGGSLGFGETVSRMLRLGVDDDLLDDLLELMPTRFDRRGRSTPRQVHGFRGMNVRARDLATIRGTGEGLYSFLFRHMYGDGEGVELLRQERLREGLLAYVAARGVELTPDMEAYVRESSPANTSRHGPVATYYDAELAELVGERDQPLVERFHYSLESRFPEGAR
jgi:hypothetical protein